MALVVTARAEAYVLRGHWVAECPYGCGQCQFLFGGHRSEEMPCPCMNGPREGAWYCQECHQLAEIVWPPDDDMAEIWEVLLYRPPVNRNWYPADHITAVKFGISHGQTVDDLYDENIENGVEG